MTLQIVWGSTMSIAWCNAVATLDALQVQEQHEGVNYWLRLRAQQPPLPRLRQLLPVSVS